MGELFVPQEDRYISETVCLVLQPEYIPSSIWERLRATNERSVYFPRYATAFTKGKPDHSPGRVCALPHSHTGLSLGLAAYRRFVLLWGYRDIHSRPLAPIDTGPVWFLKATSNQNQWSKNVNKFQFVFF